MTALLLSCTSDPTLDNDQLSTLLSLGAVTKTNLPDLGNPDLIAGLVVDTTVIHTGFLTIDLPFRMTWSMRRDGQVVATATRDFPAGFAPGDSVPVRLTLRFTPTSTLSGISDAVTFDLLGDPSTSILGGT